MATTAAVTTVAAVLGGGSNAMRGFGFSTVALVLVGVWALTGFYVVDAAERGVVTRFGRFVAATEPGLRWHIPWPVEARQIINVETIEGVNDQTRMLTADENLVDINIAVQYRRAEPVAYAFNVRDPDQTLKEVAESAIREIVGRSQLDFVLEQGRQEITAKTKELIQRTLDAYKTGIEVTTVNLQGVSVPEQVQSSQRDAIKAREDRERLALEAQAYANDILPKAKGSAARQSEDAAAYKARIVADAEGEAQRFTQLLASYLRAPSVTRQRLYFETLEVVLGNTNKVLVDTKGTGNMIYLPLDKLTEGRTRTLTLDEQRQVPDTVQPRADGRGRAGRSCARCQPRAGVTLMPNRGYLPLILVGAALLLFSMAAFTVRETELALKFRFGEIVRADYKPGLHFLTPFVNNVIKFDKRILTEDYPAEQFLTSEGKILRINFFVKWRISDVSRFYTSTSGGSEEVANRRLGEIIKDGIKTVIARRTIQQVVAADRSEFLGEVLEIAGKNVGNLGIALVDVRVKNIELPEEVSESVFNRMRQDFARQAAQLRAEGSAVSGTHARRGGSPAHRDPGQRLPRGRDHQGPGRRGGGRHLRQGVRREPGVLRVPPLHAGLSPVARQAGRRARDRARRRVLRVPEGIRALTAAPGHPARR